MMLHAKANILSTRPVDESLIISAASEKIGIDIIPFIQTQVIESVEVQQEIEQAFIRSSIVVFTSMNAVEAVARYLYDEKPAWYIYCIGNTTCNLAAQYFGDNNITGMAENAAALAETIIEDNIGNEVIFFCGDQRRMELPELLQKNGIEVNEIVVYETVAIPHKVEKKYDGILFFSPSAVVSFFQNNTLSEQTILFAIGNTTANEIKQFSKNKILISDEARRKSLVKKAITYFTQNMVNK